MNPNSHDNGPHHTGNFVTSLLLTADKLDRVRVKEECPGLFVEFLTNWNEKGGNTESKPGNGLATTTIETFADVVGKMMGRKELPVKEFVKKLNMYGFKHHPENEARKAWSRNGKGSWVNDQRYRFYHEDFHCLGHRAPLASQLLNKKSRGVKIEDVPEGHKDD